MDFQKVCQQACEAVTEVAGFIKQEVGKVGKTQIIDKDWNSLVSYVDKSAENKLVKHLSEILPTASFITEEDTVENKTSELYWIIDPLDGTTNFLHQIPFYSISVALVSNDEIVVGIVYNIALSECFYAWKDGGAFLNGTPIHVSDTPTLREALTAIGFPYDKSIMPAYLDLLLFLTQKARGVRRLGSAALDLAFVAAGRFDTYLEYGLNAWDVAGGALLVKEAGGVVSDFSGGDDFLFGRQIIAANKNIYDSFQKEVINRFGL